MCQEHSFEIIVGANTISSVVNQRRHGRTMGSVDKERHHGRTISKRMKCRETA